MNEWVGPCVLSRKGLKLEIYLAGKAEQPVEIILNGKLVPDGIIARIDSIINGGERVAIKHEEGNVVIETYNCLKHGAAGQTQLTTQ